MSEGPTLVYEGTQISQGTLWNFHSLKTEFLVTRKNPTPEKMDGQGPQQSMENRLGKSTGGRGWVEPCILPYRFPAKALFLVPFHFFPLKVIPE